MPWLSGNFWRLVYTLAASSVHWHTHTHNLLLNTLDSTEFLFSLAGNVFIEHLSSCHCYNNIHLSVSLNFQLLPVIQGSLLFFFSCRNTSNTVLWSHSTESTSEWVEFLNISSFPFNFQIRSPKKRKSERKSGQERERELHRVGGWVVVLALGTNGRIIATNRLLIACTGVQSKNVQYQW